MAEPQENITPPQSLTVPQLVKQLTAILTADELPVQTRNHYIPIFSSNPFLLISLLSSKCLFHRPNTLLSFYKWAQSHLPPSVSRSPLPLLSLLPTLLSRRKFSNAKALLTSFIVLDNSNILYRHILNLPAAAKNARDLKSLLDASIGAYVSSGRPHYAARISSGRPHYWSCR
ncbi:hypothetical protein JCGZ_14759 [Jatropha curcas]|uniref:Pentatricopeptide repeat-containing protein n=1 Tax=Jatropha curcas TaxID=180498 RepID=A0A067K8U7_JATCU|nr:hypothetical protein JCGZ_14759 [Jatropha curcas]